LVFEIKLNYSHNTKKNKFEKLEYNFLYDLIIQCQYYLIRMLSYSILTTVLMTHLDNSILKQGNDIYMENVEVGPCECNGKEMFVANRSLLSYGWVSWTRRRVQAMYVQRNIDAHSCNHICSWKAICITYFEWVFVALGIQHAMRMRHISLACPTLPYFPTLPHKRQNFEKKLLDIKCVFWFSLQLFSVKFLTLY
jgi:hypothetical protein